MKKKIISAAVVVLVLLAGSVAVASQLKSADGKNPIVKQLWGTDNK